jgi:MYXO-CTERM domain-containing protein
MNSIRFASAALAAGVGFASQASVLFSGTGFNPEAAANASGSALFQISGNTLTVTLNNTTSPRTASQGNALTGVAFDFLNASPVPTLTLVSTALGSGAQLWSSKTSFVTSANINTSWTNVLGSSPLANFGAASTGFAGAFNGGSIGLGNASPNYGVVAPGTFTGSNSVAFGGSQFPFVQGALVLTFSGVSGLNESQIANVKLMFGTDGTGAITLIPSSGSIALMGLAGLVAGRRRR